MKNVLKLSKAAKKHHLQTAGTECCPFCGNDADYALEYSDLDPVEDGDIEQEVKCLKCGRHWQDVYRLVDIHELAYGNKFMNRHLAGLAGQFRGASNLPEGKKRKIRDKIAKDYAEAVDAFIKTNAWTEIPGPDEVLPFTHMPKAFDKYWNEKTAPKKEKSK